MMKVGGRAVLARNLDLVLAAGVVAVVAMMIVPLPAALLDLFITLNLGGAFTLLLVAIYVADPLRIATMPTLLLLTTLFRLGLQISATRLILLDGRAGHVIRAFGDFVVGGNLVVGAVVFVILTVVQYVVISKGAERVAEVAARFALDAMPGRQMSIDADLRAGHIDHAEAGRRRGVLQREAQLYGSMDGATKFVKGDAVAGIVILLVNIAGGLVVGVAQRGLDWAAAARLFSRLTIGEGLVAQIPSLLISMAAGIVVTRVAAEESADARAAGGNLARDIGRQIATHPRALAIAAALLLVFAVVPGLPLAPFLVLGALWAFAAWRLAAAGGGSGRAGEGLREVGAPAAAVAVELPAGDEAALLEHERLPALRLRFSAETGIPIPPVAVHARAGTDGYAILVKGLPVARGRLSDAPARARAEEIAARVDEALRRSAADLIGIEETDRLIGRLEQTHPALVREVVPKAASRATLAAVLRRLVQEGVSVRSLADVLEALAARPASEDGDVFALAERARHGLRREIAFAHAGRHAADPERGAALAAYAVDPVVEDALRDAVRKTPSGRHLALDPSVARDVLDAVDRALSEAPAPPDRGAVIVTTTDLRRHLWELVEPRHPAVTVLSYEDLTPETRIDRLATVALPRAARAGVNP
jgi:type III secretion protein V